MCIVVEKCDNGAVGEPKEEMTASERGQVQHSVTDDEQITL